MRGPYSLFASLASLATLATPGGLPTEQLPGWAREQGPLRVAVWQWLAFLPAVLLAWVAGRLACSLLLGLVLPLVRRAGLAWAEALLARARGPLTLMGAVGAGFLLLPLLDLSGRLELLVGKGLLGLLFFTLFWSGWRAVDVVVRRLEAEPHIQSDPMARALISLTARVSKVVLFALGVVTALQQLGVQVGSMLAGLGIGGLAFALAAQKTLEHLFGSLTLGLDRPLTLGDLVKVEDVVGTVEHIGLRSTRLRTADRTLITIPNGKLADLRIENYASRDRTRVASKLLLAPDIGRERLQLFLDELRLLLSASGAQGAQAASDVEPETTGHPPEPAAEPKGTAQLIALGEGHLTVELVAFFEGTDPQAFGAFREALFIEVLAAAERTGVRWASLPRLI